MKLLNLKSAGDTKCIFAHIVLITGLLSLFGPISVESRDARVLTGPKKIPESSPTGLAETGAGWTNVPVYDVWRTNLSSVATSAATATATGIASVIQQQQTPVHANQPSLYLLPPPMEPIVEAEAGFGVGVGAGAGAGAGSGIGPNYIVSAATNVADVIAPPNDNKYYTNYNNKNIINLNKVTPQPERGQDNAYTQTEKPFVPLNIPSIVNHRLTGNWSEEIKAGGNEIQTVVTTAVKPVYPGKPKVRRKVNVEKFRECIFFRICRKSECFHFGRFGVCQGY